MNKKDFNLLVQLKTERYGYEPLCYCTKQTMPIVTAGLKQTYPSFQLRVLDSKLNVVQVIEPTEAIEEKPVPIIK